MFMQGILGEEAQEPIKPLNHYLISLAVSCKSGTNKIFVIPSSSVIVKWFQGCAPSPFWAGRRFPFFLFLHWRPVLEPTSILYRPPSTVAVEYRAQTGKGP